MKYQYSTRYNMRPNEMFGMGKESLTVTSADNATLEQFLEVIISNSSMKFENAKQCIYGSDEIFEIEEWKEYIG